MNATIIKTFFLASWEVQVVMIGTLIAGLTAADIVPFLSFLPLGISAFIGSYWGYIVYGLTFLLRIFKTKSQLVLLPKNATPKAKVIEIVAADKAAVAAFKKAA